MRLTELDPKWIASGYWNNGIQYSAQDRSDPAFPAGRRGMGIVFVCPIHRGECRLWAPFANPIDGGPKGEGSTGDSGPCWWQRSGDTFETLTLTPSIHVKDIQPDGAKTTHWHGFITNGEVA